MSDEIMKNETEHTEHHSHYPYDAKDFPNHFSSEKNGLKKPDSPEGSYLPGLERLRLILMILMFVYLFGLPIAFRDYVQTICGFVPIAFFILSGYLVLREGEDRSARIARAIKRTGIAFGVLTAAYFALNLIYYRLAGFDIFSAFPSKRLWFNFLVLNVWPFDIGSSIWYVQALFYAYIIIYFLDKWKLLKYDWIIAALLIAVTVITGELCGVIRWSLLGYSYLPGNFLTRALPYTLLGCFIHRKFTELNRMRHEFYWCMIPVGILLMVVEIIVLGKLGVPGYYGHLIGMPVVAVSVCMVAFKKSNQYGFEEDLGMTRRHINVMYYLCQPVSIGVALLLSVFGSNVLAVAGNFIGIITFLICFGIAWLIAFLSRKVFRKKAHG